jgi:hypothetical protein
MEEVPRTTSEEGYARMRSSKTINSEVIALQSCKQERVARKIRTT